MIGRNAVEVLSPAGSDQASRHVDEVRAAGRGKGEFELQRKDGSTFPASVHGRVMLDADDRPAGRVNVSMDVSERVASERALLAARDYMRAVADSMGEGMFTLDVEGRMTYMNEAAESLLGWPFAALRGRVFHDVAHFRRPDGSAFPIADAPSSGPATRAGRSGSRTTYSSVGTAARFRSRTPARPSRPRRRRGMRGGLRRHLRAQGDRGPAAARGRQAGLDRTDPGRPGRGPVRALRTTDRRRGQRRRGPERAPASHARARRLDHLPRGVPARGRGVRADRRHRPLGCPGGHRAGRRRAAGGDQPLGPLGGRPGDP